METRPQNKLRSLFDILFRWKALVIACCFISISAGLAVYLKQPKQYASSCLLSYQKQSITPNKMSPDTHDRIKDTVSTLSQIVESRTSLEKIIVEEKLFLAERNNLPMEDVVQMMRSKIVITPSKRGNTFRVTYIGKDPQKVVRVTNAIAARFIEENLKYREERASDTSSYTQDELDMAKDTLDRKEAVMRDYKLKYYNEMAQQRETNMARLNNLNDQYQRKQESIGNLQATLLLLNEKIAIRKQFIDDRIRSQIENLGTQIPTTIVSENERNRITLFKLQQQLSSLTSKYKEEHPKIKSIKSKIASLEVTIANQQTDPKDTPGPTIKKNSSIDPILFDLQLQDKDLKMKVKKLEVEQNQILSKIEQYEKWIEAAPYREAEWSALTREYSQLKSHYDYLVSQNLHAKSALNLERKQKGSQFKIEDPASIPTKPVKPDFLKIMQIALISGLGIGIAIPISLELLRTSFKTPEDIEHQLDLNVICSVPRLELQNEIFFNRAITVVGVLAFLVCSSAIGFAFYHFWEAGRIII